MKKSTLTYSLLVIALSSVSVVKSALADTISSHVENTTNATGEKIDSSMKKVDNYMGDSAVTAKVKSALLDDQTIKNSDISVTTENGIVMLTGYVANQADATKAVAIAAQVDGAKTVRNQLQVKAEGSQSMKSYTGDAATTSEIKAKLLADDLVPSRNVTVETTNGVVQLSGYVKTQAQADRAASIAKMVEGVKSVKNNLLIKP